ncbi:hypothetical protein BDZ45DRAFT_51028 [Acephala macrosclerotiorum]|nr:hypothetical protein BDZ45DRAFT_51028 [Acephala macrosclerotiorum]
MKCAMSGSWQRVANSPTPPPLEQSSSRTASHQMFPNLNFDAQNQQHSAIRTAVAPTSREVNMTMDEPSRNNISSSAAAFRMPVSSSFGFDINQPAYPDASTGVVDPGRLSGMGDIHFGDDFDMSAF